MAHLVARPRAMTSSRRGIFAASASRSVGGLGEILGSPSPFSNSNPQPFTLFNYTVFNQQGRVAVETQTGTPWPDAATFYILVVNPASVNVNLDIGAVERLWNEVMIALNKREPAVVPTVHTYIPLATIENAGGLVGRPQVVTMSKVTTALKGTGISFVLTGASDFPAGWLWWKPGMGEWGVSGGGTRSIGSRLTPVEVVARNPQTYSAEEIANIAIRDAISPARKAGKVTEIYRNQLATLIDTTIKTEITGPALLLRTDTGVFRMMASEGSCTAETLARIGVRHDLYLRAQIVLADLVKPENYPGNWNWWPVQGRDEKAEMARLACDWLSLVHSWVSVALFAGNIQPAMLYPASTTTVGTGEFLPGKKMVPSKVSSALNVIAGVGGDLATEHILGKEMYGPMWMGFYDTGEATGWLEGNFAPQRDRVQSLLATSDQVRDVDYSFPSNWDLNCPPSVKNDPEHQGWKKTIKAAEDPWFFWYYNILSSEACENTVTRWKRQYKGTGDNHDTFYTPGPRGSFELARAWGETIVSSTSFDTFGDSFEWYGSNHIEYWKSLGVLEYSVGEISAAQRTVAAARVEAKGAIAASTINQVAGAVMTVPNPIVQGVAAGCAILGSIITMSICKRRKRKKAAQAKKPLPLTLRTMTSVECSTFSGETTLETQMAEAARQILNGDQLSLQIPTTAANSAPPVVNVTRPPETVAPLGTSTTPPVNLTPGASVAPPLPTPSAVDAAASNAVVTTVPTPVSVTTSDSPPTWVWIGGGFATLFLVLSLRKR